MLDTPIDIRMMGADGLQTPGVSGGRRMRVALTTAVVAAAVLMLGAYMVSPDYVPGVERAVLPLVAGAVVLGIVAVAIARWQRRRDKMSR